MAFSANFSFERISSTQARLTDNSTYDGLTSASFTSRKVVLNNYAGQVPDGFDDEISFPFVDGNGDTLTITFTEDLALDITLTFVPVTSDGSATFTKTLYSEFLGFCKSLLSSRVHKCEVQGTIKPNALGKYRSVNSALANLIDSITYKTSVGELESAQALISKTQAIDTDTLDINV